MGSQPSAEHFQKNNINAIVHLLPDDSITWQKHFRSAKSKLEQLLSTLESSFLNMGERFLDYSKQGKTISAASNDTMSLFFSSTIVSTIDELNELLARIRRYLRYNEIELTNNTTVLQQILQTIHSLNHPFEQFEKLVQKLHYLGISTRIESKHLTFEDKGFQTLSQDVSALSQKIDGKLVHIIKGAESLKTTINQTLDKSLKLKSLQYKQAKQILTNISTSFEILIESHKKSASTAELLTDQSRTIEKHIHEIVQAMQFQDIVRQKLEHVVQAINDIESLLSNTYSISAETMFDIHAITTLQIDQLNQAEHEIIDAVTKIIDGLNGIEAGMQSTIFESQSVIVTSENKKTSQFNIIEADLSQVTQLLRDNADANYDLNKTIRAASLMVDNMSGFVQDIHQIGYQIELIALNGIVNAAHIGHEGAALSVLADAIQRLSVDAQEYIRTVSSILTDIIALADKLSVGFSSDDDKDTLDGIVNEMVDDLTQLLSAIRTIHVQVEGHLGTINQTGHQLTDNITSFTKSITIHEQVAKTLQSAKSLLADISSSLNEIVPIDSDNYRSKRLNALSQRYTMHSERQVHQTRMSTQSNTDDNCEILIDNSDSELGDNIELF